MYLLYDNTQYPCSCRPAATMVYAGLSDNFPTPVSGTLVLCADDGFVLRRDKVSDYLRQTFSNGTLILTNEPEPEETEPVTPEPTELEQLRADVDWLLERVRQTET